MATEDEKAMILAAFRVPPRVAGADVVWWRYARIRVRWWAQRQVRRVRAKEPLDS